MKKSILIVGHGYLGSHLSVLLESDTFDIFVTSRNRESISLSDGRSLATIRFDVLDAEAQEIGQPFDAVIYCVGFDPKQDASRHDVYVGGLKNFLNKLEHPPRIFVYVSSTGVYGDCDSDWVDETTLASPSRESGQACLEAEQQLNSLADHSHVVVLRLAGIYGKGRIPNRAKLESGEIQINAAGYLNLIHVEDAARIIKRWVDRCDSLEPGLETFNVSDGHPVQRIEFYRLLAELLGVESPRISTSSSGEGGRKSGSKKISNQKLVTETEYQFVFADYAEGLRGILQ